MSELYELKALVSRAHQACSAIAGAIGYALIDSPDIKPNDCSW